GLDRGAEGDRETSAGPPTDDASSDRSAANALAAWGAGFALAAALLQIPVGVWVLLKLPSSLRDQFLALDWGTTLLFAGALAAMIGLLHHLAAAALGDARGPVSRRCVILTTALFVLMVGAGHR